MPERASIDFGGHELWLDPSGALFWPEERLLAVADLHFEKSSFLARAGSLLPPYETGETLRRLGAIVAQYQPRRLLLLGDSLHDPAALDRMGAADRTILARLLGEVEDCIWLEGNHDGSPQPETGWVGAPAFLLKGLHFSHQPLDDAAFPQLIGHYHPKTSVKLAAHRLSCRCFVISLGLMVLPAFGAFTGGLDIDSLAFQAVLGPVESRVFATYKGGVYRVR